MGRLIAPENSPPVSRAWYQATIAEFLASSDNEVLGELTRNSNFAVEELQRNAWLAQLSCLKQELVGVSGSIFLEFNIPRMGSRVDALLVVGPAVFVVEFKIGLSEFNRTALDQVWDYALDLKNFHEGSHTIAVVPVLIASAATIPGVIDLVADADRVYRPLRLAPEDLHTVLSAAVAKIEGSALQPAAWANAAYKPTPTIIEAARALYAEHRVTAIRCFDAGKQNLGITTRRLEEIISDARQNRKKAIAFVTGVPGAGKTLVGLNIATQHRRTDEPTHAVLLSGNGPLVEVLRAALTRDERERLKRAGKKRPKGSEPVKQFIQNVHHFRDEAFKHDGPPADHVVVFDEAQRAWNRAKTADFMSRKKKRADVTDSEPELLLRYVDRHQDWAVVVCLVGGGQEIHTGEAGIAAWLEAAHRSFPHWEMHISPKLTDSEYAASQTIERVNEGGRVQFDDSLHLAVSMRSFRAEHVSAFVKALLDCERERAMEALQKLRRYPLVVTRNLDAAKQWIRAHARGSERYGLIASSKAQRLKPHAIDVRVKTDPVQWFLSDKQDTRSSYFMEDVATEFQVQGLEVDWACVTWDADLRFTDAGWSFHDFRGAKWQNVKNADNRNYLRNAYRVLLTRARQGMVIFVPPGDSRDHTRPPGHYDATFSYLTGLGIPSLD